MTAAAYRLAFAIIVTVVGLYVLAGADRVDSETGQPTHPTTQGAPR